MSRLQELAAKLRARGGRVTPQRMAILKALLEQDHPTVEAIYARVAQDFPMTSLVTVYRTVDLLKEIGEVFEVASADPVAHYDAAKPYQHPHLVCVECGRVADSPDIDLQALTEDMARRAGHWVLTQEAHLYGVCPDCRARRVAEERKGGEQPAQN